MHKHEFVDETRRLFSGSGCASDLTPERMDVLWGAYGNLALEVWRGAVNRLLMDPYKPTASRMEEAIGVVEEQIRLREAERRNLEARGGIMRAVTTSGEGSAAFNQLSAMAGKAAGTGATTFYVAELLETGLPALSGEDLAVARRWMDGLRQSGDDWAMVPRFQ